MYRGIFTLSSSIRPRIVQKVVGGGKIALLRCCCFHRRIWKWLGIEGRTLCIQRPQAFPVGRGATDENFLAPVFNFWKLSAVSSSSPSSRSISSPPTPHINESPQSPTCFILAARYFFISGQGFRRSKKIQFSSKFKFNFFYRSSSRSSSTFCRSVHRSVHRSIRWRAIPTYAMQWSTGDRTSFFLARWQWWSLIFLPSNWLLSRKSRASCFAIGQKLKNRNFYSKLNLKVNLSFKPKSSTVQRKIIVQFAFAEISNDSFEFQFTNDSF